MPRSNPPAPAITGDVARCTVNILADGEEALWSMDYMASGFSVNPATDLSFLLAAFDSTFSTGIKLLLPVDCTYQGVQGTVLSRNDIGTQFNGVHSGVGAGAANHLDKTLAASIQKKSFLKGQHGRGRMMMGPLGTTAITPATDANRLNAAAITAYSAFVLSMTAVLAPPGGSVTWSPCVSTRPLMGGGNRVTNAQLISQLVVDPIVGTVRRRRIGRGI